MRATWWADPRLKRCQTCAAMEAEVEQLQEERDRLRQAAESALASLGTGPAKDGYAFGVLHAALSSLSEQEGTG
jgi:hypothetical protein